MSTGSPTPTPTPTPVPFWNRVGDFILNHPRYIPWLIVVVLSVVAYFRGGPAPVVPLPPPEPAAAAPALFGWVEDQDAVKASLAQMPRPLFADAAPNLAGTWDGTPKLLWDACRKVNGGKDLTTHNQQIGSCVSHGYSQGIGVLECVEIAIKGEARAYKPVSHAWIYGGARQDNNMLRGGDGLVGAYAARFVSEVGNLTDDEVHDSPVDDTLAKKWGRAGVPRQYRDESIKFRVRTASQVKTFQEAADAIANGYPVPVCSNQGFASQRDADGFARPQGSWSHCMLFCGVATVNGRKGLCCWNSWGDGWISGPTKFDQPPGSFWVDERTADRMLKANDSFALSNFDGFPKRRVDWFAWKQEPRRVRDPFALFALAP